MSDEWLIITQIFDALTPVWSLQVETVVILIILYSSASNGTTCYPGEQTEQNFYKTSNSTVYLQRKYYKSGVHYMSGRSEGCNSIFLYWMIQFAIETN